MFKSRYWFYFIGKSYNFAAEQTNKENMYPPELVKPMEAELTSNGFKAINNPADIDLEISKEGTTLVVVN